MTRSHWYAGTVAALSACTVGFATGDVRFLVLAMIPLGFVAYDAVSALAEPAVAVERSVSSERPRPGERVSVTLAVENVGERPLGDVQVADEPPADASIFGETQLATALRPGERVTLAYDVELPRGEFEFGEVRVRHRNLAGATGQESTTGVEGVDAIVCETPLNSIPIRPQTAQYVGETPTDVGGSGVEFVATRDYQRGDPVGRINWRRYARTGELSTVEYREHRSSTVIVVVDDRLGVQRSAPPMAPDTFDLLVYAASRVAPTLLEARHRVGLTTLSELADGEPVRVGSDSETRYRIESLLATVEPTTFAAPVIRSTRADTALERPGTVSASTVTDRRLERATTHLVGSIPTGAQVLFCTPLTDQYPRTLATQLDAMGHELTVLTPDVADERDGIGTTIARVDRRLRSVDLQRQGVAVVDWQPTEPVALAIARLNAAWGWST